MKRLVKLALMTAAPIVVRKVMAKRSGVGRDQVVDQRSRSRRGGF